MSKITPHHGDDERETVGGPELRSRESRERVEENIIDAQHSPILMIVSMRSESIL